MKRDHFSVTVHRNGEQVVTIESNCLSGRDLLPGDEEVIRTSALNLLGFIGEGAPYHYDDPLAVAVEDGRLTVQIGADVLAHALKFADWAIRFDETRNDYVQPYVVVDAKELAKDVMHAMLAEREDGSSPLSDFLDAMTKAAIEDGSLGVDEDPAPTNPYTAEKETADAGRQPSKLEPTLSTDPDDATLDET